MRGQILLETLGSLSDLIFYRSYDCFNKKIVAFKIIAKKNPTQEAVFPFVILCLHFGAV